MRTMNATGKLDNVKDEMRRNRLSIMGVSEVRWRHEGDFVSDGYRVMYAAAQHINEELQLLQRSK